MADLKNLKILNWGGVEYNVGWSENDFNAAYKASLDGLDDSLVTAKNEAIGASAVTIVETAGTGDILKTYTFSQNGAEIGSINLAKDLVVSGGEIVEVGGVKYLSLAIANQDEPVQIAVTDLVDVYTGSTYIAISESNEISVKFADLDAALAAETATVGAAIKANAAAAAAAKSAADAAQAAADKAQGEVDALEVLVGSGSVSDQIEAKITAYDTATVQPIAEKLSGISEGANKVSSSYDETSYTLTVTVE